MTITPKDKPLRTGARTTMAVLLAATALAGCDGEGMRNPLAPGESAPAATAGGATEERDIEAPQVFQATEKGLWDGRPSLGGVWVAHPDVTEPERVIIRNQSNGQFVIGALFKRERESPGPRLQVSSDAAAALGMLAGQPTELNVVALRREEVAQDPEPAPAEAEEADVDTATLDPVASVASAALETPAPAEAPAPEPAAEPPAPDPVETARATPASGLDRPFIQIGIFSVEQNARDTADAMREAGMVPTIRKASSNGKTFWRVIVGPAQSEGERATLLKTIKGTGFTDAYAVAD